jgi:hypothetical protein
VAELNAGKVVCSRKDLHDEWRVFDEAGKELELKDEDDE